MSWRERGKAVFSWLGKTAKAGLDIVLGFEWARFFFAAFCSAGFAGILWILLPSFLQNLAVLGAGLGAWYGWKNGDFDYETTPEDRGAKFANYYDLNRVGLLDYADYNALYLGHHSEELPPEVKSKSNGLLYRGENHLITFGKPASGKGSGIIVPNLADYTRSFFVIDPKGQNAAITARSRVELGQMVFCLNPFGLLADRLGNYQARFNPLDKIKADSPNFVGDVGSLAASLIIQTGNDSHWSDSARELVAALLMFVCIKYDKEERERRTLGEVRLLLSNGAGESEGGASPFELAVDEMLQIEFQPLRQKAAQFAIINKEIQSIISNARTQLAFLDDPAIAASLAVSDFDFADMKRQKITVYLILPAKHLEAQSRWLRLLVTSAIDALTDEPQAGDSRVVFLLDEFAQLGRLQAIERALALVRGYGVQLWAFLQDLPQLKAIYPNRWESFLAVSGVQQFFNPNDNETAGYISKRAGQRLVSRKSTSSSESESGKNKSSSESRSDHWEALLKEWELYGYGGGKANFIFHENLSPVILAWKQPYFEWMRQGYVDPDPYHQG